jgi:hypothetical protein
MALATIDTTAGIPLKCAARLKVICALSSRAA